VSKPSFIACLFAALLGGCASRGQRLQHAGPPATVEPRLHQVGEPASIGPPETLIMGFMGGRDSWDDARPGVGRMAKKLREMGLPGMQVATIENRKRQVALELVRRAFDRNHDGELDSGERQSARLILYGQSFGGAAVVKFARELKVLDIPVILTVQVDSVGRNDEVIPSNVAAAANLFQRDGFFVRGCRTIRAENPRTTEIIGNFQFTYRDSAIHLSGVPWYKKAFRRAHARMDLDPAVWNKVAELILSALRPGSGRALELMATDRRRGLFLRWQHAGTRRRQIPLVEEFQAAGAEVQRPPGDGSDRRFDLQTLVVLPLLYELFEHSRNSKEVTS
jgi:hypothetical protein